MKELKRRGWSGFYCENNYWNLLFALSFWDVIFKSCEGAFAHPFQRSPLDLYEDDFFKRRKSVLKKALCLFDNPTCYKAEIKQRFDEYEGQVNPFVSWKAIDRKNFIMIGNLKESQKGFPDLFLYKKKKYLLGEVKGPGDQLQNSQKFWIEKFNEIGIPFTLIRVEWS